MSANNSKIVSHRQLYRRAQNACREIIQISQNEKSSYKNDSNIIIPIKEACDNNSSELILSKNAINLDNLLSNKTFISSDISNSHSLSLINNIKNTANVTFLLEFDQCKDEIQSVPEEHIIDKNNNANDLSSKLKSWIINFNVPRTTVTNLLHVLKEYHPELPLDYRSLLKTPKQSTLYKLDTGEYVHFGLIKI